VYIKNVRLFYLPVLIFKAGKSLLKPVDCLPYPPPFPKLGKGMAQVLKAISLIF
jgi:hypothetical protein